MGAESENGMGRNGMRQVTVRKKEKESSESKAICGEYSFWWQVGKRDRKGVSGRVRGRKKERDKGIMSKRDKKGRRGEKGSTERYKRQRGKQRQKGAG